MNWYVLRTKSRCEKFVSREMANREIACYLPLISRSLSNPRSPSAVEVPLFPGYIFVKPASHQIRSLSFIPGSCGLIQFSDGPGVVQDSEIENFRILTESKVPFQIQNHFEKGDRIAIRSGPLNGVEGELVRFKGADRIVLNAFVLGKSLSVEVNCADVAILAANIVASSAS